jgi:hypothetical protein
MLRNLKISGYCVVLFMVVALPFYYLRDNADATGSAFPYTKHGGRHNGRGDALCRRR